MATLLTRAHLFAIAVLAHTHTTAVSFSITSTYFCALDIVAVPCPVPYLHSLFHKESIALFGSVKEYELSANGPVLRRVFILLLLRRWVC